MNYFKAIELASFYRWKAAKNMIPIGNNPIDGKPFRAIDDYMGNPFFEAEKQANKARCRYFLNLAKELRA